MGWLNEATQELLRELCVAFKTLKLGFVIEVLRTHSEIFGTCVKVNTLENESKELIVQQISFGVKEVHNGKRRRHFALLCVLPRGTWIGSTLIGSLVIRQSNGMAFQVLANATTQRLSVNIGAHHRTPQCLPPEQLRASLEPTAQTSASKSFLISRGLG